MTLVKLYTASSNHIMACLSFIKITILSMFITKWEKKLYTLIFIACAIFLGYNWAFLNGALDERKKTDCLTPYQLMRWDESMDFSDEILDGFLSSQSDTIKKAEEEIEYWKRNYFWLKEQQNSETINN